MEKARLSGKLCDVSVRTTMFGGFQERHLTITHRAQRVMQAKLVLNEDRHDSHRITTNYENALTIMLLDDNALLALKEQIDGYFQRKERRDAFQQLGDAIAGMVSD